MSRGFLSIVVGLSAALCFSVAGVLVKPLLEAGWSPAAAVLGRVIVCATMLMLPGLFALRFDLRPLLKSPGTILLYGAIAVAGTQLAYYAAIARIPVSIALLIQYLAPLLLICLAWARTRRRPQIIVLIGTAVAICGLVLVIGPNLSGLDAVGLAFAAIGTLGLASYYLLGARVTDDLPPVTLVASGFVIAAIIVFISGVIGLTPLHARFDLIPTGSTEVPWYLLLGTVGVTTALAFVMGVVSIRRLGTRLASFLGLSEVFFAATHQLATQRRIAQPVPGRRRRTHRPRHCLRSPGAAHAGLRLHRHRKHGYRGRSPASVDGLHPSYATDEHPGKEVCLVGQDESFGDDFIEGAELTLGDDGLVAVERYAVSNPDVSAQIGSSPARSRPMWSNCGIGRSRPARSMRARRTRRAHGSFFTCTPARSS